MSSDFVLDTFTRTGNLTVPGEIGATWTGIYGTSLTEPYYFTFRTVGTGVISTGGSQEVVASGVPLSPNYGVESIFTISFAVGNNFEQRIYARWMDDVFPGGCIEVGYQPYDGTLFYKVSGPAGPGTNIFLDLGPGSAPIGPGTYKMVAEIEGMILRIYFDGALKTTRDITATGLSAAGVAGFAIYDQTFDVGPLGGGSNRLDNFRAYSIDPPPVFWMERIKTSEVVS